MTKGPNYESEHETTFKTTNIEFPLFLGFKYDGLFLKAGPYFTYALSGEQHNKGYMETHEDIHSGEVDRWDDKTKLSEIKDFNKFGCGIGGSLGYCFKQLIISATYQHGLTKLYKKSKQYEQNILVSVGITF